LVPSKVPHEEFKRAIMTLDTRTLQPNFVIQLMRLLPTDQEVAALQAYSYHTVCVRERESERERETHKHTHRSLPCNHIPGPRRSLALPKGSCLNYCVFHGSRAGCNASSLSSSSTLASTTCRKMSRLSVTHCTTSSGNKFSKVLNIGLLNSKFTRARTFENFR
jgi:hypothetical protein